MTEEKHLPPQMTFTTPPSGVLDTAFGASAGAALTGVAGTLIASGVALPVVFPFVLAGVGGVVGSGIAYYVHAHKEKKPEKPNKAPEPTP